VIISVAAIVLAVVAVWVAVAGAVYARAGERYRRGDKADGDRLMHRADLMTLRRRHR
jgi:hypothetical protein